MILQQLREHNFDANDKSLFPLATTMKSDCIQKQSYWFQHTPFMQIMHNLNLKFKNKITLKTITPINI